MDIYKEASRSQLRFQTPKGPLTTEQLWSLSQKDLATCIRDSKDYLKKEDDDELSFLDNPVKADTVAKLKFDILKDVYLTIKKAAEEIRDAKAKKEHNQKILELIQDKKEGELATKSIAELEALLQ